MRRKSMELSESNTAETRTQRVDPRDRIRADLERRGVAPELSERLSLRVAEQALKLDSRSYETLLDGVAAASGVHDQSAVEMAQHLQELQEIERLMGGFSKELAKLDEVLEVLAAHVCRMRSSGPASGERLLH